MSIPQFDITGQKVLVVGAGRGIGKGIALAFAEAGADVAVTGLTTTGVTRVAEEVRALGQTALPLTGDATKAADMEEIAGQVLAQFGQVDTLVNCVGDSIRKPVVKLPGTDTEGMTEDEWRFIVDINLTEAFQGCRALGNHLLERRQGSVVNSLASDCVTCPAPKITMRHSLWFDASKYSFTVPPQVIPTSLRRFQSTKSVCDAPLLSILSIDSAWSIALASTRPPPTVP